MIKLLDQNTINQIAAGEVVERPASVIKELVENAIDAQATAITVEVKDGGLKLMRITDNGIGIAKDEVKTAFLRHSTSKINEASDLMTIDSLGFRGEALASISAVSMVELMTKQAGDTTGARFIIEGGFEKKFEHVGCPDGTTFVIKELFFNTPARLKFMKTPSTELGYISDLMNRLAMANPDISFKFVSNGKVKLQTLGNGQLKDCIYHVYGKEVTKNLLEIKAESKDIKIHGFIGKPHISRGNRTYENYFINGRYVKSKVVERAIEDGYKAKLMLHRYPFVAFHLYMPANEVDVNVHPTKMEVRFMSEQVIYKLVYDAVVHALEEKPLIPDVSLDQPKKETRPLYEAMPEPFEMMIKEKAQSAHGFEAPKDHIFPTKTVKTDPIPVSRTVKSEPTTIYKPIDLMAPTAVDEIRESVTKQAEELLVEEAPKIEILNKEDHYIGDQVGIDTEEFLSKEAMKSHKVIGQLFDTYWIVELDEKYYVIDQHAAHEKVLYEQMLAKIESKVMFGQRLLKPIVIDLGVSELNRYMEHQQLFSDLGYEVEVFGEESVIVRSVPFIFDKIFEVDQFIQILDGLEGAYSEAKYDILLDDIASMSCKAAVKGNDRLSKEEYVKLIDDLLLLENPFNCPHGRPTIISMTKYELEKKFKRIQ